MTTITDEMVDAFDIAFLELYYPDRHDFIASQGRQRDAVVAGLKAALSALPDAGEGAGRINALVDRFLAWPLPKSVSSDVCVTDRNYQFPRSGTCLLSVDEARQMIEHLLSFEPTKVHEAVGDNVCPQGPSFHWRNGWMFARGEANYVHIWNIDRGIDLAIPPNEWDSIIKGVCGEPAPDRNAVIEECALIADAEKMTGIPAIDATVRVTKNRIRDAIRALKSPANSSTAKD